jgi:acetyltransferase
VPPVDLEAVALTLVRLSQLVIDLAEVSELDINPLLASADGVVALDARVRIASTRRGGSVQDRLAIKPYPRELEQTIERDGQRYLLRPIMPEDEPALVRTFSRLTPEEIRFRFFVPRRLLDHLTAARFSQIDYDRQMALVLCQPGASDGPGDIEIRAVVRLIEEPDRARAEFAIVVERSLTGQGLGTLLMERIIRYARERGVGEIYGEVLADNHRMLRLCRELGFTEQASTHEPGVLHVTLELVDAPA